MPQSDDLFSTFLGQMPKQVCLHCLTAIYGTTDENTVQKNLSELGDAVETVEGRCANCEDHTATYRIRHH